MALRIGCGGILVIAGLLTIMQGLSTTIFLGGTTSSVFTNTVGLALLGVLLIVIGIVISRKRFVKAAGIMAIIIGIILILWDIELWYGLFGGINADIILAILGGLLAVIWNRTGKATTIIGIIAFIFFLLELLLYLEFSTGLFLMVGVLMRILNPNIVLAILAVL